jgi:hypothetical protein
MGVRQEAGIGAIVGRCRKANAISAAVTTGSRGNPLLPIALPCPFFFPSAKSLRTITALMLQGALQLGKGGLFTHCRSGFTRSWITFVITALIARDDDTIECCSWRCSPSGPEERAILFPIIGLGRAVAHHSNLLGGYGFLAREASGLGLDQAHKMSGKRIT